MTEQSSKLGDAARERQKLLERQETLDEIHEKYSRFGSRIVQTVLIYASRAGGLRDLVSKLSVSAPVQSPAQAHDAILRYIFENGAASFLALTALGSPAARPAGGSESEAAPSAAPPAASDDELIWVDRRSGKDRRVAADRRAKVDLITRNKRFGGDRRKLKDRRVRDEPPPWPKKP